MSRWIFIYFCAFFAETGLSQAVSQALNDIVALDLTAKFDFDSKRNKGQVDGKIVYKIPKQFEQPKQLCFYLPYLDPHYTYDPIRSFDLIPRKFVEFEKTAGKMSMEAVQKSRELEVLSPFIRKWNHEDPSEEIAFDFSAETPRWHDSAKQEWFFNDFYPQLLEKCPEDPDNSFSVPTVSRLKINAKIDFDKKWKVFSSGLDLSNNSYEIEAQKIVFGFFDEFKKISVQWDETLVEFISPIKNREKEMIYLKKVFDSQKNIFGKFPFKKLVIVDMADVEKSSIPGLIAINRPRQSGAEEIQEDSSNWTYWQLATFISEQWFGASARVRSFDDLWLLRGFHDFATIQTLEEIAESYELISKGENGEEAAFHFDYRQFQDFMAAVLSYMHPYNAVTDVEGKSIEPFKKQHSLSYIRHTLALRQMNWSMGKDAFRIIIKEFFASSQGRNITPRDLYQFISTRVAVMSKAKSLELGKILLQWWTTEDWPDFELKNIEQQRVEDRYEVKIKIKQNNNFSLPLTVMITDDDGKKYEVEAHQSGDRKDVWIAQTTLQNKYDRVELEPSRQIFDWNRFNNKSSLPAVHFFPGPLNSFDDDAYTLFWLPLVTKLPGEPYTYFLVTQGFKYVQSSFTVILTYVPEEKRYGYSFYYLTDFPKIGSYMVVDSISDKGRTYKDERLIDIGIYKTVSFIKDPVIEYGLRLRNRETINMPETRHQTLAFKAQSSPLNQHGTCTHSAKAELERSFHSQNVNFGYSRQFATAEGSCQVFSGLEAGGRIFAGAVHAFGDSTRNLYFNPQEVTEARLRFDSPNLNKVESITTIGLDLLTPARIPFPDYLWVISRQARWRAFSDFGVAENPHAVYRDAGVGLWVPFGGDLVGKGSVTVLNFSVLAVLYRQAGTFESTQPGIIFDFDFFGKL